MNYILAFSMLITIFLFLLSEEFWVRSFVVHTIFSVLFNLYVMADAYFE